MSKLLTIGEAMGLFVADYKGKLSKVNNYTRYTAGAEMNVAIGTSRLGLETYYASAVGADPIGEYLIYTLKENNINTDYVFTSKEYLTGMMFKEKVEEGDPFVVNYRKGSAASKISINTLKDIDFSIFTHLHLTGIFLALSKDTLEATKYCLEKGRENNALITFDPNLRPKLWNSTEEMVKETNKLAFKCDIVLPGISEGEILTGFNKPEEISDFYLNNGAKIVIVKLGEEGAFYKEKGEEGKYIKGFKVKEIVDTVGAGDGFAVGVISALSEGKSIDEAVIRGNAIGAIQLSSSSDNEALPNREELERFMKGE